MLSARAIQNHWMRHPKPLPSSLGQNFGVREATDLGVSRSRRDGADLERLVARVDLAYPELKIAIEYEGDGHRTDKRQWRRDIQRQRDLEDRGWTVIRLTELDLARPESVVARISRAIARAAHV